MPNNIFFLVFALMHLLLVACAAFVWTHYGIFATLMTVLAGVVAMQAWLAERRRLRRDRPLLGWRGR